MAKLYFRYGAMGSAKTLNLLAAAHSYRAQEKDVLIVKPLLDKRFGPSNVKSRSGLEKPADILVDEKTKLTERELYGISCVLVDEVQFLDPSFIEQLRNVATHSDIPVICYGLRTDFTRKLFPGSQRLLELADTIEEIKSTCQYCNKKAVFNQRYINGNAVLEGPQVMLGAEESYLPVCASCYDKQAELGSRQKSPSKSRKFQKETLSQEP